MAVVWFESIKGSGLSHKNKRSFFY